MDWVLEHSTELASLSSRVLHRTTGDCTIFAFLGMYGSSDTLFVLVSFLSTRQSGVESFFMWNVRWSCFISSIALNQLSGAFPAYCLVFSFFFPVCGLCHVEPFFPYLCFSLSWVISILFWGVFFLFDLGYNQVMRRILVCTHSPLPLPLLSSPFWFFWLIMFI
jgi:hypothetical protein